jgi:hypothetical protein
MDKIGKPDDLGPIPFDDSPIPFDEGPSDTGISHTPLTMGQGGSAPPPVGVIRQTGPIVSENRITGVKTFFTKCAPGAMHFLDEQIGDWLKANPGVVVKQTSVTTGLVEAKKTEPNIIMSIWY